jgi:SAM-dependent methyltransferase
VAGDWEHGLVDLVYVDGDHSESGVKSDVRAWGPHVKPGGLMVFDDYQTPNYHGSTRAIQELMLRSDEWRMVAQVGRCIAFEKLGGAADWQRDIGAWKTFWPTEIDWPNAPLDEEAWTWVNYGWQWPGYPELPAHGFVGDAYLEELRTKSTEDMTPEEIDALPNRDKAIRGLTYIPDIYDANWFRGQGWQHPYVERLLGWFVGEFGRPESSLDLGAGDGHYSQVLSEMGTDPAVAVEVSPDALPVFGEGVQGMAHDLREPLDLERDFDLVICLEVAEHLPQESADVLCDTISRHCRGALLFTAAPPGQGGHGHCNLQPFSFWSSRLRSRGLALDDEATDRIATSWKEILGEHLPWLSRNITLFRRAK